MKKNSKSLSVTLGYVVVLATILALPGSLLGQSLSVTPITWPTVGLDSNNVTAGPQHFPVGARVCAVGGAVTNVKSEFIKVDWSGAGTCTDQLSGLTGPCVDLRPGTLQKYTANGINLDSTGVSNPKCYDFYYEAEVKRDTNAYYKQGLYKVQATGTVGVSTTVTVDGPDRYIGAEYLISQSRTSITGIKYGTTIPATGPPYLAAGGTMNLTVGNTYYIRLDATTATNGYEQLEAFINFPNTIFQVLSAESTYSADSSPFVDSPNDKLYANGCNWDEVPVSPTYASCLGTGKAGGTISVLYQVRILTVPGAPLYNPQPLNALVYDFSGSSFHYNSDFSTSWYARITPEVTFSKAFASKILRPNTSPTSTTLTYSIKNLSSSALTNLSFTDTFPTSPGAMTLTTSPSVNYSGCGSPDPSSTGVSNSSPSVTFSSIDIGTSPNDTCTITLSGVTASVVGAYNNVTGVLYINGVPTGLVAQDSLVVNNETGSRCQSATLATWNMDAYANQTILTPPSTPPSLPNPGSGPGYSFLNSPLALSATSTYQLFNAPTYTGGLAYSDNYQDPVTTATRAWVMSGYWQGTNPTNYYPGGFNGSTPYPYMQFHADTSKEPSINNLHNSGLRCDHPSHG
ncbi:MAG: hypothetical protein IT186_05900 [Acidobacteria bacterium]|nr:hypothetical protein [Acidobacteriota bacterium]